MFYSWLSAGITTVNNPLKNFPDVIRIQEAWIQIEQLQLFTNSQFFCTLCSLSTWAYSYALCTRNILDCDQSNYSSRIIFSCRLFLQSCSVIHESGSDNSFQRYGDSKFSKMAGGRILDLVQPEVSPFDPPSPKTLPRTKHEVDRITRCRDMAVRSFPKCEVGRSVGRRSSIYTLLSCTPLRYVRNVARVE